MHLKITLFLLLVFCANTGFGQKLDTVRHANYPTKFFKKNGYDLKSHDWSCAAATGSANKATRFNRVRIGSIAGVSFCMAAGAGLLATGFALNHPTSESMKSLQTILTLSGIGTISLSIPFGIVQRHYHNKAVREIETIKVTNR